MLWSSLVLLVTILYGRDTSGFILFGNSGTEDELERYNVDQSQISVSGISSGAAMATQIHVIFSKHIMGVGLVAGIPFACAEFGAATCMLTPSLVLPASLITTTESGDLLGNIDDTANMANDRVFIYNGRSDSVVKPGIGPKIEAFYRYFISDSSNIKTEYNIDSEHAQITDNYGGTCDQLDTNFINNCNYSVAFHILNHIYGGDLQKPGPNTQLRGSLQKYDQEEFFYLSSASTYSMDSLGYVYIPSGCADKSKKCRLHVAFHGCLQGRTEIGDVYVRHGGYNEVAELNDIIILYPQAIKALDNPNGCWDWFGYSGTLFATNSGYQPTALRRMIYKIAGL